MRKAVSDYGTVVSIYTADGILSTLVPPYFGQELGFHFSLIGVLVALAGMAGVAVTIPSGLLYSAGRARRMVMVALCVAAAATALYPLVGTLTTGVAGVLAFGAIRIVGGGALGLANTIYLALFIESQPPGLARSKAMGYFSGSVALGFAVGNLMAGLAADYLGYTFAFLMGSVVKLLALAAFALRPALRVDQLSPAHSPGGSLADRFVKPFAVASREPRLVLLVLVSFFFSALHGLGNTFFSLYVLSVGLRLEQLGILRFAYAAVNAVARPLAGPFIHRVGHRRASYAGLTLQAGFMMLVPAFGQFAFLLPVHIAGGCMRAVGMVANTIALAEDVDYDRVSRGVASAVYTASKELGTVTGPLIGGGLASAFGLAGLFVVGPPLLVLTCAALTWLMRPSLKRPG